MLLVGGEGEEDGAQEELTEDDIGDVGFDDGGGEEEDVGGHCDGEEKDLGGVNCVAGITGGVTRGSRTLWAREMNRTLKMKKSGGLMYFRRISHR